MATRGLKDGSEGLPSLCHKERPPTPHILRFAVWALVSFSKVKCLAPYFDQGTLTRMFVGAVKLFWGNENPYTRVTAARPITLEHSPIRQDLPSQHDLPRQLADESRLARAAQISMAKIDALQRLLEPVE